MQHPAKYLIHADIRTSGVVERSDVVGAIFGQTEGLLGEELDLRDLQDSSKVGRIHVDLDSEDGRSFASITVASALDRAETAVLAASLETIERVGPCRAECTVTHIEDARAAKRRELVDRAAELLGEFEDREMAGDTLVEEVRKQARVEDITEYEGLPAGPRVEDSDAIIVVEGRSDVRQLLEYGIKNVVAVEGTNVPDAVARLTHERTTTAFLDGDRGGDLILRELDQVGDLDYVTFAPAGQSVEDLDRATVMSALRKKLPYEQITEESSPRETFAPTDGGAVEPPAETAESVEDHTPETAPSATGISHSPPDEQTVESMAEPPVEGTSSEAAATGSSAERVGSERGEQAESGSDGDEPTADATVSEENPADATPEDSPARAEETEQTPETLAGHIEHVIGSNTVRLLDKDFVMLDETAAEEAFEAIVDCEETPHSVVLDGTVTQRLLDVSAQRGVGQIIGTETDEFVKQPTSVRVQTV